MMKALRVNIKSVADSQKGQSTVDYGLKLFMAALTVVLALQSLGEKVADILISANF